MSDFEQRLARELAAVGIHGSLRRRIQAEIADHLGCDPQAALGDPREIAADFADQLGTARARTAATAAFASLVVAGGLFAIGFVAANGLLRGVQAAEPTLGFWANVVAVVATQVAFVAGCLAVLRPLQRRGAAVLPAAEAAVIVRRAGVGVAAGIVSMACLGVFGLAARTHLGAAWSDYAVGAGAAGIVALLATLPSLRRAAALRPVAPGPAGDICDDLGVLLPAPLQGRPWRVAGLTAGAVAVAITLAAVPATDTYDGLLRGVLDACACLAGFATLGPFLGLWSPRRRRAPGEA